MLLDFMFILSPFLFLLTYTFLLNKLFKYNNFIFIDFLFTFFICFIVIILFLYEFNNFFFYIFDIYDFLFFFNFDNLYYSFYFDEISQNSFLISMFSSVFFFLVLILSKPVSLIRILLLHIILIVFLSIFFIFSNSIFIIFICFELLLLVSLNLLKLTSKSERILEAVGEMFLWTLFGSFFLLLAIFINFNFYIQFLDYFPNANSLSNILSFFFLIGFGVKIPVWPCLSWLLKAHVEASVEFSILLSGFIVKLGILGLIRILDNFQNNYILYILLSLAILAIIDATIRLFAQQDLKRIVALTTVIEMNWLMICFVLGDSSNLFLANLIIIIHSFSTTSEFLLVECISKRFNTRDLWLVGSLWYNSPNLWYISILVIFITIGFPGTSIFLAKFLFLPSLLNFSIFLFIFFLIIFFLILPVFFIKLWLPLWFGFYYKLNNNFFDITKKEFFIFFISILVNILLGLFPQFFLFFLL